MPSHRTKPITPNKIKLYIAYITILIIVYIYAIISNKYGDILKKIRIDILGKSKCSIPYEDCEKQVLDGYGLFRMFVFFGIGHINPHSHIHIGILSILLQIYAFLLGSKNNHLLNPLLNIVGYSLGSATCSGCV